MPTNKIRQKGAALILAVVALSMLVIIAIPFASSMAVEKRASQNTLAKVQAKMATKGAINYAIAQLSKSHDMKERDENATPFSDAPQEQEIKIDLPRIDTNNPYGEIWSVDVQDEQGKVNLHSATPWLLGNLIASAITQEQATDSHTTISVDSTSRFPQKNGFLWVNGELISYSHKDKTHFFGCERGIFQEKPNFIAPRGIRRGTLIIDAHAYRIISHQMTFGFFHTIEEVKTIANVGGDFAISPQIFDALYSTLTVHSTTVSNSNWINEQPAELVANTDPSSPDIFTVDNALFYIPGMIVKIESNNNKQLAMILSSSSTRIQIDRKLKERGGTFRLSVKPPAAININSAAPRVLFAIFKGLRVGGGWIGAAEASTLVNEILKIRASGGSFSSLEGFQNLLNDLREKFAQQLDINQQPFFSKKKIRRILSAAISTNGLRNRFHGINIRPSSTNYRQPFPVLAPIIFKSNDTYTLTSTAVINNSSGIPLAQHMQKTLVSTIPSETIYWKLNTQKDFQDYLNNRTATRVTSHPVFVDMFTKFPQKTLGKTTGISLDTFTSDYRAPQGSQLVQKNTFDNTYEGVTGVQKANLRTSGLEVRPGCISLWFKIQQAARRTEIFNMGDRQQTQNRISCFIEGGNLILQVFDGAEENSCCEITAPIPQSGTWTHLMATWYSTEHGGLALWIDGRPVGEFSYDFDGTKLDIRTTKKIDSLATVIPVSSTRGLTNAGAVKIGNEIIEYERISGRNLIVRKSYSGFERNQLARGARGSIASEHIQGVAVVPLGYSVALRDRVFPATTLTSAIGKADLFTITTAQVSLSEGTIKLETTKDFPPAGFALLVDPVTRVQEKIRYLRSDRKSLKNCVRAQLGTSSAEFETGAFVVPISISVADNSEYPDVGAIQIDNEWLQYSAKVDQDIFIFNPPGAAINQLISTQQYDPNYRKVAQTASASHFRNTKVLPVFRLRNGQLGRFDTVTLVDNNDFSQQDQLEVNWSQGDFIAFTEDVSRIYEPQGQKTRILKFPSGELPSENSEFTIGQSGIIIDELQVIQARQKFALSFSQPTDNTEQNIAIDNQTALADDGGILKVGNEYIAYSSIINNELQNVERGFLNSKATNNDANTFIYPVFFLPISSLTNGFNSANTIEVGNASDFPSSGYIRSGNEIISYSNKQGNSFLLPETIRGNNGRGAFGSTQESHSADKLVHWMPSRYWDRSTISNNDNDTAFFEAAKTAHNALWKNIKWEVELPSKNFTAVKFLVRIDGKPNWTKEPQNVPGQIYEFNDTKKANTIDVTGDLFEMRVYFIYKNGAFSREVWKDTPLIKSIEVSYEQLPQIYQTE
ncbi:LamG-like jellyroll fold domain-containing protein [Candidatus Uabimicrobium sp. HlEnr_7]|uniref:LamG-like jellyroll fold domain-containing protein n=1 Tax=Candidatus Uabimicrobium helgolandensis TaxID=3095367 RepID=UPI0035582D41